MRLLIEHPYEENGRLRKSSIVGVQGPWAHYR